MIYVRFIVSAYFHSLWTSTCALSANVSVGDQECEKSKKKEKVNMQFEIYVREPYNVQPTLHTI